MPLSGGTSDKLGNYFEAYWTIKCLAQILSGEADTIRLEPPDTEGVGAEFWLQKGSVREYHQVKRQITGEGRWQFSQLEQKKVLSRFREKLENNLQSECHFISTHSAHQLEELSNRARDAKNWQEFNSVFLESKKQREDFEEFLKYWGNKPGEEAYNSLKRIFVQTIGETLLIELVTKALANLVAGNPADVAKHLIDAIPKNLHRELRASDLRQLILKNPSFTFHDYNDNVKVFQAISDQNRRYAHSIRDTAILGHLLWRDEIDKIAAHIKEMPPTKQGVLVAGGAGFGKSSLLLQLSENFQNEGWPVLAIRLDRLNPSSLPKEIGNQLDLPDSPVKVLARLAKGQPSLFVIDQLDAVSSASARQSSFFDCVRELLEQAGQHPNLRVLLACRTFDLDNDYCYAGQNLLICLG